MERILFKKSSEDRTTIIKNEDSVPYIAFKAFDETGLVKHGFSTRLGGVSTGYLASLNLGYSRGDDPENVTENHRRIAESIGFDYRRIVTSQQTHTTNIRVVTEEDAGKGIVRDRDYTDIDGLITNVPNLPLATYFADCVPLFFLDPVKKAIGLSHSGWRGTIGKIGAKTVRLMGENYGSRPENIIACIGPSICQDCYEVSEDVAEEFRKSFENTQDFLFPKENGRYQLDLWEACRMGLLSAGLLPGNIHVAGICTCCNKDLLFSHRATGGQRGNLAAFLMFCK